MAIYKVVGSYEEFYESVIEADSAEMAIQIFYQNGGGDTVVDGNWVDITIDDEFEDEEELEKNQESIDYTMANYDPSGGRIRV